MAATIEEHATNKPKSAQRGWREGWRGAADGCRRWLRRRRSVASATGSAAHPEALQCLRPLLLQLEKEAKPLPALASQMEQAFLAIADSLMELPGASDKLVKHSHQLVAMSTGRDNGDSIYQSTHTSLSAPLQFVDAHWETTGQIRRQLQESLNAIDGMLRHEDELARTVAPLKYIQTLFKVESAALDAGVQGMFLALTDEINGLQRKVSDTFGEKFQVLRDLRRILADVVLDLEQRSVELGRFLADRKGALDQALTDLRSDLEQNRQREAKLTQITEGVAQQVGRLVLGLQAQDIVAQKIGHLMEGIGRLVSRAADPAADRAREAALLRFLVQAATIEQAQIESIRNDLRQTEGQLISAITEIENQVGQLDEECVSMREFDRITVGYPGLIESLLETVDGVSELVDTTVTSTDHAFAEVRPLGGRTSNVTATMRELSAHIRVIAINAQVQAARLDNGTGLEVLAAATNRVAVETGSISEEIASRLDQFTAGMDGLVKAFTSLHERGAEEQKAWRERSIAERQALHNVRDITLSELHLTAECADQIRTLVRQMGNKVNVSRQIDPGLRVPGESLGAIAERAAGVLQQPRYAGLPVEVPPELNLDQGRTYTMESERRVYEAALAAASAATATATATPTTTSAPDGDSTPGEGSDPQTAVPVVAALDTAAPPAAATPGISQLTGLAAPAASASGPADPEKKEFGDNVDLF